eukprot:m.239681 g.239681  ORF g.239681 m.239681 type:complete len:393 (-) comp22749_c0_seq1:56-1234(-)
MGLNYLLILLFSLFYTVRGRASTSSIIAPLLVGYDKLSRPYLDDNKPVDVELQYRVNRLYGIDSVANMFSLDVFFRLRWKDPRLVYNASLAKEIRISPDLIWKPDVFIFNSIAQKTLASFVAVFSDGTVYWPRQQLLNLTCKLDLHDFPFDVNEFPVDARSFSYGFTELVLRPFNNTVMLDPNPVPTYKSTLFSMVSTRFDSHDVLSLPAEEPVRTLTVYFTLQRQSKSYILKYFCPLAFLVFLSTLSFFIDPKSPPARVASAVLLVLSALSFNLSVGNELPKLDYVTLIDWFVIASFLCCLSTIVEYSVVNNMVYNQDKRFHSVGLGIDEFFRSTVPILWLLISLCALGFYERYSARVAMVVMTLLWLALMVTRVVFLFRASFWKPTEASK